MAEENSKDISEAVTMLLLRVTSLEQVLIDTGVVDKAKFLAEIKKNIENLDTFINNDINKSNITN